MHYFEAPQLFQSYEILSKPNISLLGLNPKQSL
jgi:hypothetical protein